MVDEKQLLLAVGVDKMESRWHTYTLQMALKLLASSLVVTPNRVRQVVTYCTQLERTESTTVREGWYGVLVLSRAGGTSCVWHRFALFRFVLLCFRFLCLVSDANYPDLWSGAFACMCMEMKLFSWFQKRPSNKALFGFLSWSMPIPVLRKCYTLARAGPGADFFLFACVLITENAVLRDAGCRRPVYQGQNFGGRPATSRQGQLCS